MWQRSELKANAKIALKANYWKAVVVSLIMGVIMGGGGSVSGNAASNSSDVSDAMSGMDTGTLVAIAVAVLGVVAVIMVISILLSIFVFNILQVGCQRFFIKCKDDNGDFGDLGFGFKNGYGHIALVMFLRGLFISLWTLLLVVPGIIKSYEYMMIPYILAENPDMDRQEVFAMSKKMMTGNKWNAFVLDLSFIGWGIVALCTCGIAGIFYVSPYIYLTKAELYKTLKTTV